MARARVLALTRTVRRSRGAELPPTHRAPVATGGYARLAVVVLGALVRFGYVLLFAPHRLSLADPLTYHLLANVIERS